MGIEQTEGQIRSSFALSQNYPNPFNPTTAISYRLITNSFVTLVVCDVLCIEVSTLVDDVERAGTHLVRWDASALPSGVYFYRLIARHVDNGKAKVYIETKKMMLAK